ESNATWLNWGISNHTLFGTPRNEDVGTYWVRINISDENGGFDEHNFTLTVLNVNDPPIITTEDVLEAPLNVLYEVDYDATDIDSPLPQLKWLVFTNATSWLEMDYNSGILSGTPEINDLGWYNVNVTVKDLDGDQAWHEFILVVTSNEEPEPDNDPPEITTIDKVSITAGESYNIIYKAADDRTPVGSLIWFYNSNASWLGFNKATIVLSGSPTLDHVGWYWVNVSVNDGEGGFDSHNFTVTVYATTNQPPDILTEDDVNAVVEELYSVDYEADDDRTPLDKLQWSLETNTSDWLRIDPNTGALSGTPELDDVGSYWVKVSVFDGEDGWDHNDFTLYVTTEPITKLLPKLSSPTMTPASGDSETMFTFFVDYSHQDSDLPESIQVVIDGIANNMESTNGHYEYSTKLTEGNHTYYFTATLDELTVETEDLTTPYIEKAEGQPEDGEDDEDNTMLYAVIGIIVIIIVVMILLFIFLKKKKPPEQPATPEVTPQVVPHVEPAPQPVPMPQVEEQPQPTPQIEPQVGVQEPHGQAPAPRVKTQQTIEEEDA
ncbi:MAG: hypothetical protein KAJ51_10110, partial [Thermoplasmata archaeon]|nr:hypothetical protein [Thermoplasmata archaeon]